MKIYRLGRERYESDRQTYHVSADLQQLPQTEDLPALLEDFHAREVLHVTFGSALTNFGSEIKSALTKHADAYQAGLELHFEKHLALLK